MKCLLNTLFLLFLLSCDRLDEKLKLVNTTEDTIYYQTSMDTILFEKRFLEIIAPLDTIKEGYIGGEGTWEYKITNESVDSTLHIFITKLNCNINKGLVDNLEYERLDLKISKLDSMKWIVVYPKDFK